jgi:hypothetical protein
MAKKILQVAIDENGGMDIQNQNFTLIELLGVCDALKLKYEKDFKDHILGNQKASQPLVVKSKDGKTIN